MAIIILLPALFFVIALFRGSTQQAFRNVVLPTLFAFPMYFVWKIPHVPPVDATQAVMIPLGIVLIFTEFRRWRLSVVDGCLGLFLFTSCCADYRAGDSIQAGFNLFASFTNAAIPYMAGRLIIEKNGERILTVKRVVTLLFATCLISAYEYRMMRNPFTLLLQRFFPGQETIWHTQIRWGFGRVAGPYGQSELAGIIFFFGVVLTLWLSYYHLWEPTFFRGLGVSLSKAKIIVLTLVVTLIMTQARGPWLGCLFAVPIALIGRSARVLRSALLVCSIGVAATAILYIGLHSYVSATPTSDEQQTAQYRQELLDNYLPIAKQGGLYGWGTTFPRVNGQSSIDNEYLLITLMQGYLGLAAFALISAGTVLSLIQTCTLSPTKRDQYFAFSLLGIFVGLLLTITTVFLGNQPYVLFFLLAGWAQALPRTEQAQRQLVFERVYT